MSGGPSAYASSLRESALFQEIRRHPHLFEAAKRLAAGYVAYTERWPTMRPYYKDQAELVVANVATIQTIIGQRVTAGQLATTLASAQTCSERRAASIVAAMRKRGDLLLPPDEPPGSPWRIASVPLRAFICDRIRLEIEAFAPLSPLIDAAAPVLASDPGKLHDLLIYARTRFYMSYQSRDPAFDVMQFFVTRDYGLLFHMFVIGRSVGDARGATCELKISEVARMLGVSRAHIRKMISDAQASGLVEWNARESELALRPALMAGHLDYCAMMTMAIIENLQRSDWTGRLTAVA
jgi:hypothetical protein